MRQAERLPRISELLSGYSGLLKFVHEDREFAGRYFEHILTAVNNCDNPEHRRFSLEESDREEFIDNLNNLSIIAEEASEMAAESERFMEGITGSPDAHTAN